MLTRQLIRKSYVLCRANSKERGIALIHPLLSSRLELTYKEHSPSWKELCPIAGSLGKAKILLSFMILPAKMVTNNHQSQGGHGGS